MPYDEADETDPLELIGVELPGDEESHLESCRVLADEFARLGFDEEKILGLFRNPFYGGANRAYQALGDEKVRAIVRQYAGFWGGVWFHDRERDPETGLTCLTVLDGNGGQPGAGPASGRAYREEVGHG